MGEKRLLSRKRFRVLLSNIDACPSRLELVSPCSRCREKSLGLRAAADLGTSTNTRYMSQGLCSTFTCESDEGREKPMAPPFHPHFVVFVVLRVPDWESLQTMRPNAQEARRLLEDAMARDPENPWAIHLYTHLMEAGGEAAAAVAPAKKLQYLAPGAPHLQVHKTQPLICLLVLLFVWFNCHSATLHGRPCPRNTKTRPKSN